MIFETHIFQIMNTYFSVVWEEYAASLPIFILHILVSQI